MVKWVAIVGDFETSDKDIVFHGGNVLPINSLDINGSTTIGKTGLLLFNDVLSAGEIEINLEFEKQDMFEEAAIVFNYQNINNFMCAGVGNKDAKYEYKIFNGNWINVGSSGFSQSYFNQKYHIKLELIGSAVNLYIDGIRVLASISLLPIQKTNIGLWVSSKGKVKFSNYKVQHDSPKAFVISQFGANYDDLYNDVIKPVCENYHILAERADEMATSTLILGDIITSIQNASLIIADTSPNNPNVFYEVGYAHAINKPTILLCDKQAREYLPFDVSGFRTIFYDDSIGGKKNVEQKLTQYIRNITAGSVII